MIARQLWHPPREPGVELALLITWSEGVGVGCSCYLKDGKGCWAKPKRDEDTALRKRKQAWREVTHPG